MTLASDQSTDHLILCLSQPSLSAADEARYLAALRDAGGAAFGGPVTAIRLEGGGTDLVTALRTVRDSGAMRVRVQPVGFPMAANIMAWLPGAVAHFAHTEAQGMAIDLADVPDPALAAGGLIANALQSGVRDGGLAKPSLGKPGWQFVPDHDIHILVCTGPRCAFRGGGTLLARLKAMLTEQGLSDRCLTTTTGCLFPCNQGPVLALYPRNLWFAIPDEDALRALVCEVIGKGGDLPHLRLAQRFVPRRAVNS